MWNKDFDKITDKRIQFFVKRTRSSIIISVDRELRMLDKNLRRRDNLCYRIKRYNKLPIRKQK